MLNRTKYNALVPAIVAAFVALPVLAEQGGPVLIPVADTYDEQTPTCAEAAKDEAFLKQLAMTDGAATPEAEAPSRCDTVTAGIGNDVYTEFGEE